MAEATAKVLRRPPANRWWAYTTDRSGKTTMRSTVGRTAAIQRAALFLTYQSSRHSNAVIALDRLTREIEAEFTAQLEKETPEE